MVYQQIGLYVIPTEFMPFCSGFMRLVTGCCSRSQDIDETPTTDISKTIEARIATGDILKSHLLERMPIP